MDGRSAKEREGGNEKNNNDKSNFVDFWGGTFETAMPGTFVSAAGGTFETVMPGTFHSATGGTFVSAAGGTFETFPIS